MIARSRTSASAFSASRMSLTMSMSKYSRPIVGVVSSKRKDSRAPDSSKGARVHRAGSRECVFTSIAAMLGSLLRFNGVVNYSEGETHTAAKHYQAIYRPQQGICLKPPRHHYHRGEVRLDYMEQQGPDYTYFDWRIHTANEHSHECRSTFTSVATSYLARQYCILNISKLLPSTACAHIPDCLIVTSSIGERCSAFLAFRGTAAINSSLDLRIHVGLCGYPALTQPCMESKSLSSRLAPWCYSNYELNYERLLQSCGPCEVTQVNRTVIVKARATDIQPSISARLICSGRCCACSCLEVTFRFPITRRKNCTDC